MSLVPQSRAARRTVERSVPETAANRAAPAGKEEYQFLLGCGLDAGTLAQACRLAGQWGVHPHHVLIANGWLSEDTYYRALAETEALPFKADLTQSGRHG